VSASESADPSGQGRKIRHPLLVGEEWAYADRRQSFVEDVTRSGYFCPCCFRSRDGEIRGVHLGEFIRATKSFACGTPSNRGNDGSTHIFVRSRQHTEMFTRKPSDPH
jgi:hypothetical protein